MRRRRQEDPEIIAGTAAGADTRSVGDIGEIESRGYAYADRMLLFLLIVFIRRWLLSRLLLAEQGQGRQ